MRTETTITAEINQVHESGARINHLQNEGHTGYDHTNSDRLNELGEERHAAWIADWTKATTIARRAKWNETVRAMADDGKKVTPKTVREVVGYSLDVLQRAMRAHGIK